MVDYHVAHSSNLVPRDSWFALEQRRIKIFDRLTDLHQSHSTGVVDETLVKSVDRELLVDGVQGDEDDEDDVEPLLLMSRHKEEASAHTSSLTK